MKKRIIPRYVSGHEERYPILNREHIAARRERERLVSEHQLGGVPGHRWVSGCRSCAGEIAYGISGMVYPSEFRRRLRANPWWRYHMDSENELERLLAQSIEQRIGGAE